MRDLICSWLFKGQIRKLDLLPGDILLVRMTGTSDPEQIRTLRVFLGEKLPESVTAMIADDSVIVEVLRPQR